jgi:hypothetical protein
MEEHQADRWTALIGQADKRNSVSSISCFVKKQVNFTETKIKFRKKQEMCLFVSIFKVELC